MYDSPETLACVGCGVVLAYAAQPRSTVWLRTDVYEHLGVCRQCESHARAWDAGEFDPDTLRRALLALGRDASPSDVEKTSRRLADRIAWFALPCEPVGSTTPKPR